LLVGQEVLGRRSTGRENVVKRAATDAPPPGDQELKLDPSGLWILSPLYLSILPDLSVEFITYLARSAKVAERAICFTDRNFYLFFLFSFF